MRWICFLFVAALLTSGACLSQTAPQQQAPVVRRAPQAPQGNETPLIVPPSTPPVRGANDVTTLVVETRLVNLPLNVVDAAGAPVGGLERDQFEVREDGKLQKLSFFEREASTPLSIVLAIDSSESLTGFHKLEREAGRKFVKALLRPQDELDLMEFASSVREIVPFTNDTRRIDAGLSELQNGDETALYEAIYLASDRLKETNPANGRRRVIVLITDGDNTKKGVVYSEAIEEAQRAGALVYCIIVVPVDADAGRNTGGEHALIQMAQDTGGKYFYVQAPQDLVVAFQHVSDDLRTQYLLGYYAPQGGADTSFRNITISLTDPNLRAKYRLRHRSGYYAASR